MIVDQFQRERVFKRGNVTSPVMHDVLTQAVTVRKRWAQGPDEREATLFHEVKIVPFEDTIAPVERDLYALKPCVLDDTQDQFFARIVDALCDHIVANWRPEAMHLLFHSSGWDSRVLSLVLRKLAQERGQGWLGKLIVFSFGEEAAAALPIIDAVGWPADWVVTMPDPADWLWPLFDMGQQPGRWFNGAHVTVPVTRHSLVRRLEQLGVLPAGLHDVQAVSGFGSDYAMRGAHQGYLRQRMQQSYRAATSIGIRSVQDEILPWFGYGVARTVIESSHWDMFALRPKLVEFLDPGVAEFPRWAEPWSALPDEMMRRAKEQYRASWYGHTAAPGQEENAQARPNWSHGANGVKYSAWWSHWTAACYCERLIAEGYALQAMTPDEFNLAYVHKTARKGTA